MIPGRLARVRRTVVDSVSDFVRLWARCIVVLICLAALPPTVLCQTTSSQQPASTDSTVRREPLFSTATPVDRPPKLDGTLNDPLWQQATPITNFLQREPYEGQPATERTEVRVLYTKHSVYFGIKCFDSEPKKIVATELRRDVSQQLDDYFEIVIDSAHDRRNAYVFQVTPLGTQRDALITEEQQGDTDDGDSGWDGIWTSEARIGEQGWTVTVAIPFSTLNFMKSNDVIWGINFKRFIRRKNEEDLWSGWQRVNGISRVSQAGELHGISDIGSGRLFVIKPYGLLGVQHLPETVAGTGLTPGWSCLCTGGVDAKVGLRSNLVANVTVNTDFADTEVDLQNFNLTPYPLYYPEKRQFFLENAGIFNFPLGGDSGDLLFFSRQIGIDPVSGQEVPINVGAKVTGSVDNFQLGLMEANTRESGPNPSANYLVGRVKRSLWGGSYIGAMAIDKASSNPTDSYNQTYGADTRLVFWRNLVATAYAAETRTPGISTGQTNWGVGADYKTNWLELFAQHRTVGPNFNPEVGFLERTDCLCNYVDATLKARPLIPGVREVQFEGFLFHAPDTQHVLQTQEWQGTFRVEFHNGSYSDDDIVDVFTQRLTQPFNIYRNVYIPVGTYHWARHQLTYGTPLNRRFTMRFFERFGSYYNGNLNEARLRWTYRASERLSFDFSQQWNKFQLPVPGGDFSVLFGGFQTNYSFSRFLMLTALVQVNTANNQAFTGTVRLRWNYRPDSDLYIIYTAGQRFASLETNAPQYYQNSLTAKLTYSWRP
jgi:hypothetical protein